MRYLILLLLLAACGTTPVVMVNPETGATVQCGPYRTGSYSIGSDAAAAREAQCIRDYKEQGYVRK